MNLNGLVLQVACVTDKGFISFVAEESREEEKVLEAAKVMKPCTKASVGDKPAKWPIPDFPGSLGSGDVRLGEA